LSVISTSKAAGGCSRLQFRENENAIISFPATISPALTASELFISIVFVLVVAAVAVDMEGIKLRKSRECLKPSNP
jgi:hypothetical protein